MLNNQGNHDRGHDQNNNRGFGNQFGGAQGQGAFPLGGEYQFAGSRYNKHLYVCIQGMGVNIGGKGEEAQ